MTKKHKNIHYTLQRFRPARILHGIDHLKSSATQSRFFKPATERDKNDVELLSSKAIAILRRPR